MYEDAHASLSVLIGELVYKNQLLREVMVSKDKVIEQITNHLMIGATSPCSCGAANQLTFVRNVLKQQDLELARHKKYRLNEFCNVVKHPSDNPSRFPLRRATRAAEKLRLTPMVSVVSEKDEGPNITNKSKP